jgi:hypothetical protein
MSIEQHTVENASVMILPLVLVVMDFILEIVGYYKPVYTGIQYVLVYVYRKRMGTIVLYMLCVNI